MYILYERHGYNNALLKPLFYFSLPFLTQLRKAMIEHVSDTFVDPCVPLTRLVVAAKQGKRPSVETCSEQFLIHGEKLVQVSSTAHIEVLIHVHVLGNVIYCTVCV